MKFGNAIKSVALLLIMGSVMCASASRDQEVTLVLVPRDDATVQLGLDIANKYPSLLVSYKVGANDVVSLHGWTGTQWVNITAEDYRAGNFFRTGPDSALIIETADEQVPETLVPPVEWCASVSKIATTEMRPLIHLVGQYFDFPFKDWQWFAKRYNKDLDSINPEGLNVAWYNKPLSEHFKQSSPVGSSDLQYWFSIRQPVAVTSAVAEPAPVMEESVPVVEEPAPVMGEPAPVGEDIGNPLTNAIPPAVVMGAADAPEDTVAKPVAEPAKVEAAAGEGSL
ncbi:MAG: hypothetical protein K9M54_03300 [Kiritimatiellales bacterium]|nr:hypothetical protein [Kiritimatiellales bacterium]